MTILDVCAGFGFNSAQSTTLLTAGLINNSYKITVDNGDAYFLQKINTSIFNNPAALQNNYLRIQQHLAENGAMALPALIPTINNNLLYENDGEAWRCFQFLPHTYSPDAVNTPEKAYEVARCFGSFTAAMQSFNTNRLAIILPNFHNLHFRFQQFRTAVQAAVPKRIKSVKDLIEKVEAYVPLVAWFQTISRNGQSFPPHIMHHDCKISNILFDTETDAIRCPIDFDTTQAGLFFSDIGDMVRTIVCNKNENDTDIEHLEIRPDFYNAVTDGYLSAMADYLTNDEKNNIHYAGSVLVYMQAIRFLTDYLNGNIYYQTAYPDQNKDRTKNQLRLLDLLQHFIANKQASFE